MSNRKERYLLAVQLAQEILANNPQGDELAIQQAIDDIRDEIAAGRRNQSEWGSHLDRARALIGNAFHSVKVDDKQPHLRLVK